MKVVIVDDHPLVRRGLSAVLKLEANIEISGESETVEQALELIKETKPDLAIVDLKLGNRSGLEVVENIKDTSCRSIILTSSTSEQDVRKAEAVGADGYVLKEALPEELLLAIKLIFKGKKYFDPGLMEMLFKKEEEDSFSKLTPKEREVLIGLGEGLSNQGMAKKLMVTEFTVKKHVSQILNKLCVNDRTQAALLAQSKGLVSGFQ
ncbi:response regulator transcription factor [Paenibacillus sp. CGMCC 1.16610]|uniref:Response regulator transcription factor n=2 Tax=Paenibacillus TaxID=44249 RepID=A0ABU6D985_9BACL|nr:MULTISPECIES: response regulator transcription factor [Paenibacillus]MBA2938569.1 response regulator transcription factor [Paenibacillus sp. CGMCC 1.16610]MCY9656661.1 response regulator transcription factor [Paenibacillus anseongense]MEB4794310.1 response regulator transcription factor [Paenibacillus chondroitinus]MVQ38762.1 response regulator [Paenibacillus anseongense]